MTYILQRKDRFGAPAPKGGPITLGEFMTGTWLPRKRRHVRATTAYRYSWFVDCYVNPAICDVPLRRLRADHLDSLLASARHRRLYPPRHSGRRGHAARHDPVLVLTPMDVGMTRPLDPAMRRAAYEAGRRQGEAATDDVRWLWES